MGRKAECNTHDLIGNASGRGASSTTHEEEVMVERVEVGAIKWVGELRARFGYAWCHDREKNVEEG